jgi:ABC-type sugar transport system permease subunit
MAFTDRTGSFTLGNFVRVWKEVTEPTGELRLALRNTCLTFGLGVLAFPFQTLVAYFIYKKVPGASVYRILFFLPKIIFSVALAMIFCRMVNVNGIISHWVQNLLNLETAPELLADSRFANTVVLLEMLWLSFPGDLIIWGGTFGRIPVEVLESGKIDGVNWWTEFTKIIVPIVWPTVALKIVLMFCGFFNASGNVFLLTRGDYGTMTLNSWIYIQLLDGAGHSGSNVYNYMSAVGLVMTVIAVGVSLGIRKWTDKAFGDVEY